MQKLLKNQVIYARAIQGHAGGNMVSPELMGHAKIPYDWKEFFVPGGVFL